MPSLSAVLFGLAVTPLVSAGFSSIPIITATGTATSSKTSTTASTKSSSSSSSLSSSSSTSTTTTPAVTTTTAPYDPLVLTTTFTQPEGCDDHITQIAAWSTELWQNIVNPLPTLTYSSCYPSQFYTSAVATAVMPPYKQLVCPLNWKEYKYNSTYIICCPYDYELWAPYYYLDPGRPGKGALCSSSLSYADWDYYITVYDETALASTVTTSVGPSDTGTYVLATAFDGIKATVATTTASLTTTSSTSTKPTTVTTSTTTTTKPTTAPSTTTTTTTPTTLTTTTKPTSTTTTKPPTTTSKPTTTTATSTKTTSSTLTAISQLPSCGQTCFNNMFKQYADLGCASADPGCMCGNINFYYGVRDCANGACGTAVASTVIAFESAYCSSELATATTHPVTTTTTTTAAQASPTAISQLPSCGQTCFQNMLGQYADLGCSSADPACVCKNINFYYGIRDCANGACGTAVASTVIAFESRYCASATATATAAAA